jgi:transposase-like protein
MICVPYRTKQEKVDLVISDGHKGIKSAASKSFVGSSW